MEAKDLVVDKSGEGEVVEQICKILPYICISIFTKTLIIKPVDLCDLSGLVVSTENGNSLRIPDLEGNKESNSLY
jgi:hypothetical protein